MPISTQDGKVYEDDLTRLLDTMDTFSPQQHIENSFESLKNMPGQYDPMTTLPPSNMSTRGTQTRADMPLFADNLRAVGQGMTINEENLQKVPPSANIEDRQAHPLSPSQGTYLANHPPYEASFPPDNMEFTKDPMGMKLGFNDIMMSINQIANPQVSQKAGPEAQPTPPENNTPTEEPSTYDKVVSALSKIDITPSFIPKPEDWANMNWKQRLGTIVSLSLMTLGPGKTGVGKMGMEAPSQPLKFWQEQLDNLKLEPPLIQTLRDAKSNGSEGASKLLDVYGKLETPEQKTQFLENTNKVLSSIPGRFTPEGAQPPEGGIPTSRTNTGRGATGLSREELQSVKGMSDQDKLSFMSNRAVPTKYIAKETGMDETLVKNLTTRRDFAISNLYADSPFTKWFQQQNPDVPMSAKNMMNFAQTLSKEELQSMWKDTPNSVRKSFEFNLEKRRLVDEGVKGNKLTTELKDLSTRLDTKYREAIQSEKPVPPPPGIWAEIKDAGKAVYSNVTGKPFVPPNALRAPEKGSGSGGGEPPSTYDVGKMVEKFDKMSKEAGDRIMSGEWKTTDKAYQEHIGMLSGLEKDIKGGSAAKINDDVTQKMHNDLKKFEIANNILRGPETKETKDLVAEIADLTEPYRTTEVTGNMNVTAFTPSRTPKAANQNVNKEAMKQIEKMSDKEFSDYLASREQDFQKSGGPPPEGDLTTPETEAAVNKMWHNIGVAQEKNIPIVSPSDIKQFQETNPIALKKLQQFELEMNYKHGQENRQWLSDLSDADIKRYRKLYEQARNKPPKIIKE